MTEYNSLIDKLKSERINFVSFCFTDILGKLHKMSYHINNINEDVFKYGIAFDGSSIKGWKQIHNSDSLLIPDITTAFADPFSALPCYMIICNVQDGHKLYNRDPRAIALNAEELVIKSGYGDEILVGPEMEFFVFDNIRFSTDPHNTGFAINSDESEMSSLQKNYNLGHKINSKLAYLGAQPMDSLFDIRAEMCNLMVNINMNPTLHHHEVAPSQCEVGFEYSTLTKSADNVQKFKYLAKNVTASFNKSLTFMPKPLSNDNGSGMHTHMSIRNNQVNSFYQKDSYGQLSDNGLYFIGGVMKHAKAINAFSNPTTNSYKRLVPGFEAPVNLAYSACNRSASIRIPYSKHPAAKRIEIRFPDPSANPYLAFAAILMAGIDGIQNKIHPGNPVDKNLYTLSSEESKDIDSMCSSLTEALESLDKDRAFLENGNVFSSDFIDSYITIKKNEISQLEGVPHPIEFKLYYSC